MLQWPRAFILMASAVAIGKSAAEYVPRAGEKYHLNKTEQMLQLTWAENQLNTDHARRESRELLRERDWRFFCNYMSAPGLYDIFCMINYERGHR